MSINISGVETFSLVDYPGTIAAVVFMQGCPWRCPFCHNAELQKIDMPTHFVWEKFTEFLQGRKKVLDAVVFSGGEPLVQNALPQAMQEVKTMGYKIGLHTGGYRPEMLKQILPLVDWVGFDIKAPFEPEIYRQVTGPDHFKKVCESLEALLESGVDFECRTTCDPRILTVEDIYKIGESLKQRGVKKYFIQKYRPIAGDNQTSDAACEQFRTAPQLQIFAQWFQEFEFRK